MQNSDDRQHLINVPPSSDEIHNLNCYRFLRALTLPDKSIPGVPEINFIRDLKQQSYDAETPYGALYYLFMVHLEEAVSSQTGLQRKEYDPFFLSLYENKNGNLEKTYEYIQSIALSKTPSGTSVQKSIEHAVKDREKTLNPYTPSQAGSVMGRFWDMISPNYKASHKTSLATQRSYRYNLNSPHKELRFGTQGQTQNYWSRVSPLFERFLSAQLRRETCNGGRKGITHIYFNNLGKDRSVLSYEGRFESGLTVTLQRLEKKHPNVAVITLPADKGLMAHHDFFDTHPQEFVKDVRQRLLDIVHNSSSETISDFYISPEIRALLFKSQRGEEIILEHLLNTSFSVLGFHDQEKLLSPAQSQAVWVHFNKFELPQFIIEKLAPTTFNFSCKDAIDRGGISSAYYNLMCSFATQTPMTRDEFETALHAAPLMVKGRGMNNHLNIIWNTVDQYMQAHPDEVLDSKKSWLVAWRDANCPKERAGELLERRLNECIADLSTRDTAPEISHGLKVLQSIQKIDRSHPVYDALLLDVVVTTYALCLEPQDVQNPKAGHHYQLLIKKMQSQFAPSATYMQAFWEFIKSLFMSTKEKSLKEQQKQGFKAVTEHMGLWKPTKPHKPSSPDDQTPRHD